MQSQSFLWFGLFLLTSLLWGCQSIEDEKLGCTDPRSLNYDPDAVFDSGECDYSDSYRYYMPEYWSEADEEGNLMIVNQTESPLHLYQGTTHLRVVPPKATDFLVNIPVKSDVTQLDLYRAEQVDHVEDPGNNIFRSWRVVLEATSKEKDPKVWGVSNLETGEGNGRVYLYYPDDGEEENQLPANVDVFLFSKEGGRVTSIEPGTDGKIVYLAFGNYVFWYQYWVSDPASADGYRILGWKQSDDIVLNDAKSTRIIDVPSFDLVPENSAALKVVNQAGKTIIVKLGDRLIENLVVGRENTQALSSIVDRDSMVYPVDAGRYLLSFSDQLGSVVEDGFDVDLDEKFVARVSAGEKRKTVLIENQTNQKLYLGTSHYLGVAVNELQAREVKLPETVDQVTVFNNDSTFLRQLTIDNNTLTILEE
jgi:hypothetical protein